jgi:hypothetical protein
MLLLSPWVDFPQEYWGQGIHHGAGEARTIQSFHKLWASIFQAATLWSAALILRQIALPVLCNCSQMPLSGYSLKTSPLGVFTIWHHTFMFSTHPSSFCSKFPLKCPLLLQVHPYITGMVVSCSCSWPPALVPGPVEASPILFILWQDNKLFHFWGTFQWLHNKYCDEHEMIVQISAVSLRLHSKVEMNITQNNRWSCVYIIIVRDSFQFHSLFIFSSSIQGNVGGTGLLWVAWA